MGYGHIATSLYFHLAPNTHALVGRARVPVGKACVRFARLGTEHLYLQFIVFGHLFGDIELELTERAIHVCTVGDLLPIQPYISAIADAIELQQRMLTSLQ